jgi:hypothetical protein
MEEKEIVLNVTTVNAFAGGKLKAARKRLEEIKASRVKAIKIKGKTIQERKETTNPGEIGEVIFLAKESPGKM